MEVNSSISDAIPSVIAEKRCASAFPDSILIILLQIHEGLRMTVRVQSVNLSPDFIDEKSLSGPFIPKGDAVDLLVHFGRRRNILISLAISQSDGTLKDC